MEVLVDNWRGESRLRMFKKSFFKYSLLHFYWHGIKGTSENSLIGSQISQKKRNEICANVAENVLK